MRKIILHMGYPKTGTSSIEWFLRDNREALGRLGFYVPTTGQGRNGAHHALCLALAGLPMPAHQAVSECEIVRELSEAPAETILISSEKLTDMLANPSQAERLVGWLRSTGADLIGVMYVRNHAQWLNSSYSQGVKSFRRSGQFRDHLARVLAGRRRYGYSKWADIVQRCGLEMRARPFSEKVRKEGVIEDYLRTIGCAADKDWTIPPRVNESAGPLTVEAARRLQDRVARTFGAMTMLQARHCSVALKRAVDALAIADPRYCGLDDKLARQLEAAFAESNDSFAEWAWGCDWNSIFEGDVGGAFESNDYRDTGVPAAMQEPLREVLEIVGDEIGRILKRPRLAVEEDWNRLSG